MLSFVIFMLSVVFAGASFAHNYQAEALEMLHRSEARKQEYMEVAAELKQQYTLGYRPTNKNRDGSFRQIRVELADKSLHVRTKRNGYPWVTSRAPVRYFAPPIFRIFSPADISDTGSFFRQPWTF